MSRSSFGHARDRGHKHVRVSSRQDRSDIRAIEKGFRRPSTKGLLLLSFFHADELSDSLSHQRKCRQQQPEPPAAADRSRKGNRYQEKGNPHEDFMECLIKCNFPIALYPTPLGRKRLVWSCLRHLSGHGLRDEAYIGAT